MALILRTGGSQSPDRWLREPRNNQELKEEIGATIVNEPILLGNVISDSGLTGNRVDVYLVEIESFQQNQLIHEGIKQIIEIPVNKMDDWIRQGKIDDGFSLSAYALYQSHIK